MTIYPNELQLNKSNSSDTEIPFLDLNLCISNGTVSTKIYDKRDDFDFDKYQFPFSGWRCSPAYLIWGIHISTSPELLQTLVTLTIVIKPLLPNFLLSKDIVILNFVRRFRNFIAALVEKI